MSRGSARTRHRGQEERAEQQLSEGYNASG
jgi:hypothetical protein